MDSTSTKSISGSLSDTSHTSSISAKLRRLKIEENLLFQSINKCAPDNIQLGDKQYYATSNSSFSDFKNYSAKTKESLSQIKLLFQDIRTSTSKEMLQSLDIDDVKRTTIELDNSIKTLKSYLQLELTNLKAAEKHLNQYLNENPATIYKLKKPPRVQTAKYNEIVPSPVKSMMNSPLKCSEVKKFQEFMMNSGNRYGGWSDYHHNIFVNYWKKHFGCRTNTKADEDVFPEQNSSELYLFLQEILPKLQDISEEEVKLHVNWYTKFLYLKERQQQCIDKWRSNKKIIRSVKVEPDNKQSGNKNESISNKIKNRLTYSDMNMVSGQLKVLQKLVLQPPHHDGVRRIVKKCLTDELTDQRGDTEISDQNVDMTLSNFSGSLENCPSEKKQSHFQKTTKQWNIRVNSKNEKTATYHSNIENVTKLHIPSWRVGL